MDGRSFDELARKLGRVASRRSTLKALLGGAAAVAVGVAVADGGETDAARRATCAPGNALCAHNEDCCSGSCVSRFVRRGRQRVSVGRCSAPFPTPLPPTPTATPAPAGLGESCASNVCGANLTCSSSDSICRYVNGQTCGENADCDSNVCDGTCIDMPCVSPSGNLQASCNRTKSSTFVYFCPGAMGGGSPTCSLDSDCTSLDYRCGSSLTCFCDNGLNMGGTWVQARNFCVIFNTSDLVAQGASCPA